MKVTINPNNYMSIKEDALYNLFYAMLNDEHGVDPKIVEMMESMEGNSYNIKDLLMNHIYKFPQHGRYFYVK